MTLFAWSSEINGQVAWSSEISDQIFASRSEIGDQLSSAAKPLTAEEIRGHPRFSEARRAHIEAFAELFAGDRFRIRLLADSGASMIAPLLVGLHAAHDDDDRSTWATLGYVQRLVGKYGVASPRRLDDLIARLVDTGYIEPTLVPADRRVRVLKPSQQLLCHDRAYVAALYRPLDVLHPDTFYRRIVQQDPNLHLAIRRAGLALLSKTMAFMARNPHIMRYLTRHAGYLALLMVAGASLENRRLADDAFSFTTIADRLGASRTHIRNLLEQAEADGHVTLAVEGGRIESLRPELWDALDDFIADLAAGHDAVARLAIAAFDVRAREVDTGTRAGALEPAGA